MSGVCSAGLASTVLPAASAAAHLAAEDGQREVPRADAHHGAQRAVGVVVEVVARLGGVVAQEVDRLAHLGDGVGEGLAGLRAPAGPSGAAARLSSSIGARARSTAARSAGGWPPRSGAAGRGARSARRDVRGAGFAHLADECCAWFGRDSACHRLGALSPAASALACCQRGMPSRARCRRKVALGCRVRRCDEQRREDRRGQAAARWPGRDPAELRRAAP